MFVSLANQSCYSFLEGLAHPAELVRHAAAAGCSAVGLADRGFMSGCLEFYEESLVSGIQPIFGISLPVVLNLPASHGIHPMELNGMFLLIAQDLSGWQSLCRLSSALLTEPEWIEKKALPFSRLSQEAENLICLTGGLTSPLFQSDQRLTAEQASTLVGRLQEVFPAQLFIQLYHDRRPLAASQANRLQFARRHRLPLVFAPEVHYLEATQKDLHQLAAAMRKNETIPAHSTELVQQSYRFILPEEATLYCADVPEAVENTARIASLCNLNLPTGSLNYPVLDLGNGKAPSDNVRLLAYQGALARYKTITPRIKERLEHELTVIEKYGYASLFLIMSEIIEHARQADIPTASRGSASSSLVAHCLGITTPDPIKLNLFFERFLNPARTTPPDIDTDICSVRRDDLIRFVYERFGNDKVAMVATINRFRPRSALREVAKAFGLPPNQINRLVSDLPYRGWGPPWLRGRADSDPFEELSTGYTKNPYPAVFNAARFFIDRPHHLSIHPGGVVISPGPLTDFVPTVLSSKGIVITQFDLDGVEKFGLVKIDLLGIRGLTVLGDVADHVRSKQAAPRIKRLDIINTIPFEDALTSLTVRSGKTIGCFQIESPGMRATLREIQAESIDDIRIALALYRPGPMTGGLKDAFIRRHIGLETVEHIHPALEPLLAETHGVILYQEQVLQIAHELAGLSLSDADLLRRAMSHFDPGQQMQLLKQRFIEGAGLHSAVPVDTAEMIWSLMAAFAGYGFPKAHAASYAEIAWRSAWFKAHFPAQFLAAVLANWGGYYGQRVYLMEARHLGIPVRTPHIQFSSQEFSAVELDGTPILFMGLNQVRELTRRTQQRIITLRPYHSFSDFIARVDPRPKELDHLIKVGSLSGFGSIPSLLANRSGSSRASHPLQMPLFDLQTAAEPDLDDWPLEKIALVQEEILGISVDVHRLELFSHQLKKAGVISTSDAVAKTGQVVRVAGMRQSWRRATTLTGESVYLLTLEDLDGSLIVVVDPIQARRVRSLLKPRIPVIVEGMIEIDESSGEPILRARRVHALME